MIELKDIVKRYNYKKVLNHVSLTLPNRGLIGIVGPSGCGKTTLLNIIGGNDHEFQGDILYKSQSIKNRLARYKKQHVGFIFQQIHLIHWLSVKNNIHLSSYFYGVNNLEEKIDVTDLYNYRISDLSLGQRQKVSYLRAFFSFKDVMLCDEPTGSLDLEHANQLMRLLKEESKNRLIVIVSHDLSLVKKYCDEIYELDDGEIVNHEVYQQCQLKEENHKMKKKRKQSLISLSFHSLMSHKKRTIQLMFGLFLSLITILMTLTLCFHLENQIYQYIYSLVPPSTISMKSHDSFDEQIVWQLNKKAELSRVQLFLNDYELLGVGFQEEKYQESETLFIADDSSPYENLSLLFGTYPKKDNEILLSQSTALHLCSDEMIDKLIGKKLYAWYKHGNQVDSIAYLIVGITSYNTTIDTLYQKENAYIRLIETNYKVKDINSQYGIIYVDDAYQRSDVIKELNYEFPSIDFIETGVSTSQQVSKTMQKIKTILYLFSSLAMVSSLILVGEVMFLDVIQKKKDYAIMSCFGATSSDFIRLVVLQSFELVFFSYVLVFIFYHILIFLLNDVVKDMFINLNFILTIDYQLLLYVLVMSLILVLLCHIIPLCFILKLNTVDALKN